MAPKIATLLFPLSFDWCGLFICKVSKFVDRLCAAFKHMLKATAISGSQEMFRATGRQPPFGQLGSCEPPSRTAEISLLCCSSAGRISELFKYIISPVEKSPQLSTREYPLGSPDDWGLFLFSFVQDRMQPGKKRKVIRHRFPRTKKEENMRNSFSHLCFIFPW